MSTAIYALTTGGCQLAVHLAQLNGGDLYLKREQPAATVGYQLIEQPIKTLVAEHFQHYDCLVFIMATGIVVRTIAPLLQSKTSDPAVIVIDELGRYVISLLSGHLGGANDYALQLADLLGAQPVITTATDLNQTLAFDVVAKQNNLVIANINQLMHISQAMIDRRPVALYTSLKLVGDLPSNVALLSDGEPLASHDLAVIISERLVESATGARHQLHLIPQNLVIGIGCRRGTTAQAIDRALRAVLAEHQLDRRAIRRISSVDVKRDEAGLLAFCAANDWPLDIISRREIAEIQEDFAGSDFVEQTIGVRAVAAPCATISGGQGRLIVGKTKCDGITIAVFRIDQPLNL